jgi:hypothetical protein
MSASFPTSTSFGIGLTLVIALILLASNFTLIDAQQQQMTSQPEELGNVITTPAATIFQSANDSFRIQVPDGWIAHDINNSTSAISEETRLGYGLLAQLCSEEEQQQGAGGVSTNASGSASNNTNSNDSCQGAQEEVVHIIRYPDLNTRLFANNITSANNNMTTTDKIVSYQLQKLQEAGYRSMRIIISTDMAVNLTNPQTNERIATLPAKLVEMTYSTNFAPNEIRRGYLVSTAANSTAPNLGMTKGYAVFYESNSTSTNATAAITSIADSLPPSTRVGQVLNSFELVIASPEVAQPAEFTEDTTDADVEDVDDDEVDEDNSCHPSYPDTCIPPPPPDLNCDAVDDTNFEVVGSDPHGFDGDNDGIGCEGGDDDGGDDDGGDDDGGDDDGGDDDGGDDDNCQNIGGTSCADDYDETAD